MQTTIEAFWDDRSALVAFHLSEPQAETAVGGLDAEYAVFSTAAAGGTDPFLIAIIEPRNRAAWSAVRLPDGHRHISIRPLAAASRADEVRLSLVTESDRFDDGHWIVVSLTDTTSEPIYSRLAGLLSEEDILQDLSAQFGEHLIWMAAHRCSRERNGTRRASSVRPSCCGRAIPTSRSRLFPRRWPPPRVEGGSSRQTKRSS